MKKYTLYVGLNDKDTKRQEIDTIECFKIVSNLLSTMLDGGTIYSATGIYKHENGSIVIENTLRIEIIEPSENGLKTFIQTLKNVLNQESIIVQTESIISEFV